MESRSTNRMMIFLIVVLFGTAIFGSIRYIEFSRALGDNPWQNYKADLLARAHTDLVNARKLWKDRRPAHYRLTIERVAPASGSSEAICRQDIEVTNEAITTTYQDTCSAAGADVWMPLSPDWLPPIPRFEASVTQLLALVEHDSSRFYWTAQGVGCDFITLETVYDDQMGYPAKLTYRAQPPPVTMGRPIKAEYFNPDEPKPGQTCLTVGVVDGPTISVHLTPMQ